MSGTPNRIDATFARLRSEGQTAFIAYVCGGDPDIDKTRDVVAGLDAAGVDVIELGIPFSDPLADGVVIQMAAQRALDAGATTPKVLELVRQIRTTSQTPIVLFTYLNPVYSYGFKKFSADASEAGADGILLLDLPPDEAILNEEFRDIDHKLQQIRLISPTTPADRIKEISAGAEGFVYYVSREGVTGEQATLSNTIGEQVALIKSATEAPVAVGFGISTPEQAKAVAGMADGVVVGSAIVRLVGEAGGLPDLGERVRDFVKPLVDAVKSG
jgi:tryptophan synthase alpha chain